MTEQTTQTTTQLDADSVLAGVQTLFERLGGLDREQLFEAASGSPEALRALEQLSALMPSLSNFAGSLPLAAGNQESLAHVTQFIRTAVRALINSDQNYKIGVVTTGTAAAVGGLILAEAGASKVFTDGSIPYAYAASKDYLDGRETGKAVSEETAIALAVAAFYRAQKNAFEGLKPGEPLPQVLGVSATGSIATGRARRGEDCVWIAVRTTDQIYTARIDFEKGHGAEVREWQNALATLLVVNAIFAAADLPQIPVRSSRLQSAQLTQAPDEQGMVIKLQAFKGAALPIESNYVVQADGAVLCDAAAAAARSRALIVYPGSFNPMHYAHDYFGLEAMRRAREDGAGVSHDQVLYEISVTNADPQKPVLAGEALQSRVTQHIGRHNLAVVDAPYFFQKLELYPNAKYFVVGFDTARRILDFNSYPGATDADKLQLMRDTLKSMAARGVTALVAGRTDTATGEFLTVKDLNHPFEAYRGLFENLNGHVDVSSSMIRKAQAEHTAGLDKAAR